MDDHVRESVGRISRWALLAVAGLTVLTCGIAVVGSAVRIAGNLDAEICLPDALWQSDHPDPVHVTGRVVGEADTSGPCVLMSGRPGEEGEFVPIVRRKIYPRLRNSAEGIHRLVVRGGPHDMLAFRRREAVVVVVPPGRKVYLIDARLAWESLTRGPQMLRAVLDELRRHGTVAAFHGGSGAEVDQARSALAELPLLHPTGHTDDAMAVLWHTAWTLNRNDKRGEVTVITADADLADLARKARFRVYQIGSATAGGMFADLAKFKEYLAARPIPMQ